MDLKINPENKTVEVTSVTESKVRYGRGKCCECGQECGIDLNRPDKKYYCIDCAMSIAREQADDIQAEARAFDDEVRITQKEVE